MKKEIVNKNKWFKPEISKIKLNPEQAILSCCDALTRVAVVAPWNLTQCENAVTQCGTYSESVAS
ncbi:MAG: hypothetical protein PHP69_02365 [Candidatus Omnitrophica bacterium]|nr:hypothetical protein [Candidatus Omnitrophota bacterium]MDD5080868.1 hypothetical protein [Candidatus Omnitrophota bacterium]MDD5441630.1 hypothetical protein [Candidatus Omnitrophota bacterium]